VSVTGALVIDTVLMLLVARVLWRWRPWQLALAAVAFGGVELTFLAANLSKVAHGGWLPLVIAVVVFTVMTTWRKGREIVAGNRRKQEGSLREFVDDLYARGLPRVAGTAVFPHPGKETTPLALRANVEHNKILHEDVLIVSASSANVPHVAVADRFELDHLGHEDDRIQYLAVRFGFSDEPNLPEALAQACATGALPSDTIRVQEASFFLSRGALRRTKAKGMAPWRKILFLRLAHNAADPAAYFVLPVDRTVTMGSPVDV
jgi:KUP system potassium uptake protein